MCHATKYGATSSYLRNLKKVPQRRDNEAVSGSSMLMQCISVQQSINVRRVQTGAESTASSPRSCANHRHRLTCMERGGDKRGTVRGSFGGRFTRLLVNGRLLALLPPLIRP